MVKLSNNCQEICKYLYHEEIAKFACNCLDTKLLFGEDEMNSMVYCKYKYSPSEYADSLYFYIDELVELHENSNERMCDAFDFKCELKIMPIKSKTLFTLYTQKKKYKELFGYTDDKDIEYSSEKYPQISPYMYYNSSDEPSHLTIEEWRTRRDEWNKALRKKEEGLIYSIAKTPNCYNTDILTKKIESMYDKRVEKLSFEIVKDDFTEKNDHLLKGDDIHKYLSAFNKYSKSEEYKKDLKLAKEKVKEVLPKTYTKEDFKTIKLTKITK